MRRPAWHGPAFLATFALASAVAAPGLPALTGLYAGLLAALTGSPTDSLLAAGASVSFRPVVVLLLACLAAASAGAARDRLRLGLFSTGLYSVAVLFVDGAMILAPAGWVPSPLGPIGGLLSVVTGVVVLAVTVFTHRRLPDAVRVATRRRTAHTTAAVLPLCLLSAGLVTVLWRAAEGPLLGGLRLPFNGWLHEEAVVFFLATVGLLRAASAWEERAKPRTVPPLTVAFLVPAHNEEAGIAACISTLDAAAAHAPAPCLAYVVDNASTDGTAELAGAALARCDHLVGRLLSCAAPGKSRALNHGLERIEADGEADIVVRVDADTLVEPELLTEMLPWFWDRSVGGVGGFPLPREGAPRWLHALRLIEVYCSIAFFRVAQSALDATTVMPGSIAGYRRRLLTELGGFGQGFNGEDSDITMRIGRLGYRIVTDASVRVRTECPATLAQLREQRQRWTRGRFHMAARNLSSIAMGQGVRALWMLPASLFNACRRCLMVPLLAGAAAVELAHPAVLSTAELLAVAKVVLGLQVALAVVVLMAHRQLRAVPYAPLTLVYRLVLAYIAFETVLTLTLRPPGRRRPDLIVGGHR